jgi:tRNA(Ile)-lysidine synthase
VTAPGSSSNSCISSPCGQPFLELLGKGLGNLSKRHKYLVGVSGGRDSMALLNGLLRCGYRNLVICHLDHRLRGGVSAADAIFVAREARRLGVRLIRGEADVAMQAAVKKQSIETAARDSRYLFFSQCALGEKCNRIFLGHHGEDQLETILHHFFRGSGKRGLGGMREISTMMIGRRKLQILRPMLEIGREIINSWVDSEKIAWREDASNSSPAHSRNRLRNELVPSLEKILGRNFRSPILRVAKVLSAEDEYLDDQVKVLPFSFTGATLPVDELRGLCVALQRRVALCWLRARKVQEAGFREVEAVLSLLQSGDRAPARVNLPDHAQARRRSGKIYFARQRVATSQNSGGK